MRMNKLNFTYLISLISLAKKYIENNNIFSICKGDNLNDIGKLYEKICKDHKNVCRNLLNKYDWDY